MKNRHNGFIKIDRQILEWEHFGDPKTVVLFLTLLVLAEYKDTVAPDGTKLKRGQVLTSLQALANKSHLSIQEVRTRLLTMQLTKELTNVSSSKNRIITVLNYDKYQFSNKETNKETNKEINNIQEKNNTTYYSSNKKEIKKSTGVAPLDEAHAEEKIPLERKDFNSDEEYFAWLYQ